MISFRQISESVRNDLLTTEELLISSEAESIFGERPITQKKRKKIIASTEPICFSKFVQMEN